MKLEYKISTIHNVISDLKAYVQDLEDETANPQYTPTTEKEREAWQGCQLACEYITENEPHL